MPEIKLIAFDADDTLWHNETIYQATKAGFFEVVAPYADANQADQLLEEMEGHNILYYGYGIKSFVLSMIETSIQISGGQVPAKGIQRIISLGKDMLSVEMQKLEGVEETLEELSRSHSLMIITKGDLMDQENKLARSGLSGYFQSIEIVSQKNPDTYQRILERHQVLPEQFLMIGNSLKSDILPVIQIGGWAVYVPYELTWVHETLIDQAPDPGRYFEIENIGMLPELVARLSRIETQ